MDKTEAKKVDLVEQFSFVITKATYDEKSHVTRFSATASDTELDLYDQRMSMELFRDFIHRATSAEPAPVEFQSDFWQGGMPYVSVSHYPDMNGDAVPGEATALYIDGNRFKTKGFLYNNPLGIACGKSIKQSLTDSEDHKVRISIAFLDWKHAHGNMIFERKSLTDVCPACRDGKGEKVFLAGQLIHLALTRVPVNTRTDVEVDLSMAIKTQVEDAESIVGEELAKELEEKKRSLVSQSAAVVIRSDTEEVPVPEISVIEEAKVAPKGDYGNVTYADAKNKKYPVDTEAHIRAAWSYIHMPKNQKDYSPEEVKAIEGKIVSAWKKVIDKAGPAEMKKGMILMSSVISEGMDMTGMSPDMYMPYDGAVTFADAQAYEDATDALNEFYSDWNMFQMLAGNIISCGDVTDKMGAMKSLVDEFKSQLDQSTAGAVSEMAKFIKDFKKPVEPMHPLDDAVSTLKSKFTEVSSNQELPRDQKLQLVQESFAALGETIKVAIPESQVQPETVEQTEETTGLDVGTLKSAFAEALAPLMQTLAIQNESIRQLQQAGSANAGVSQSRQAVPIRRSIDPSLVKSLSATNPVKKTSSLHDIIHKSVYLDGQ